MIKDVSSCGKGLGRWVGSGTNANARRAAVRAGLVYLYLEIAVYM